MTNPAPPVFGPDGALPEGAEKRHAVEAMFDRVAPRYDRMNRLISLGLDRRWRRRTIAALDVEPTARVLDLACGTGDLARDLAAQRCRPVGIDLSATMLRVAHADAPLVRGVAEQLPFADATFDGVVCGFALRNFVDLDAVFTECARVLRPGCRFAALDATVPEHALLRAGNTIWFRGAVPVLGRIFSGNADAYRYLPRSTAYLPPTAALLDRIRAAGFTDVSRTTMTGGSVQLLTAARA
jgi:demethylmenaquinone methyltransferase / 2-methoxy-6-polyprenyl-1,4-benzoquinol methylase